MRMNHQPGTVYRGKWRGKPYPMRCYWVAQVARAPLRIDLCDSTVFYRECDCYADVGGRTFRIRPQFRGLALVRPDSRRVHLGQSVGQWNQRGECGAPRSARLTADPDEVTCKACKRTRYWREWIANPLLQ